MTKQKLKNKLLKRAQFATKLLSYVPFIRMVAINGSLASGKINDDSDIDFFLISENKHLWTARFFAIGILTFFNLRAKGKRHEHKVCLNHILSNFDYKISFKSLFSISSVNLPI